MHLGVHDLLAWLPSAAAVENRAVVSDIPALMLTGEAPVTKEVARLVTGGARMKHKRWTVLIVLVLVISPVSCSTPTRQREPVTITFACHDYLREWYKELAQTFHEEYPYITVQILSADEILGQTASTSVNLATSDEIGRLARAADSFVEVARMLGDRPQDAVLDLAAWTARRDDISLDDFYPSALAPFQRGDRLWGLPFEVNTYVVYYSPQRFDEAGVAHPEKRMERRATGLPSG